VSKTTVTPFGLADALAYVLDQDARRGPWMRTRPEGDDGGAIHVPPYPAPDNPMLTYVLDQARVLVEDQGVEVAIVWAVATRWLEGHVEGFDRAQALSQRRSKFGVDE